MTQNLEAAGGSVGHNQRVTTRGSQSGETGQTAATRKEPAPSGKLMSKKKREKKNKKTDSRLWGWVLVGGALAAFAGILWWPGAAIESMISSTPGSAITNSATGVVEGKALFQKNCAVCHGVEAVGENTAYRNGGEKPEGGYYAPALNGTAHAWHHPPDMLFRIVKKGSPAKGSPMVGFQGRMNDGEIEAVLAYLRSIWPEKISTRYAASFGK